MGQLLDIDQMLKSQKVRLFDVYALGPFLIWAAFQKKPLGSWTKRALFVSGVMTMAYNYRNYLSVKKTLEEKKDEIYGILG